MTQISFSPIKLIARTLGARAPDAPHGPCRKLGNLETAWARMDAYSPTIFCGVAHLSDAPAPEVLRKALDLLQDRKPMLRVAISARARKFWFSAPAGPHPIPLDVVPREGADHWPRAVEEQLCQSFEHDTAPLARFLLLQGETDSDLVFSIHHAIIDGRSGEALIGELLKTCAALQAGTGPEESGDQSLSIALDDLYPAGFQGLARLAALGGFLARQMWAELRYRRRLGRRQAIHPAPDARRRVLPVRLSEDETRQLTRKARAARVPLNSILHSAMQIALWRVRYAGTSLPMRGISFGDLRPYLSPPQDPAQMGVYISMLQYTADVTPGTDVWGLARQVTDQIDAAAKSTDKFAAAHMTRHIVGFLLKRRSMRMGMVALSFPGPLSIAPRIGGIRVNGLSGAVTNNPLGPELAGFGMIVHNRLGLDLQYLETDMTEHEAEAAARHIRELLAHGGTAGGGAR